MSTIEDKIENLQKKLDNLFVSKEEYNKLKDDQEIEINNLNTKYIKFKNDKEIKFNNLKEDYNTLKEEYVKLKNDKETEINDLKEKYDEYKKMHINSLLGNILVPGNQYAEHINYKTKYNKLLAEFEEYKNGNHEEDIEEVKKNYIDALFKQGKLTLEIINKYNYLFDKKIIKLEDIPYLKYEKTKNDHRLYIEDKLPIFIKNKDNIFLFKITIDNKDYICYYYDCTINNNIITVNFIYYLDNFKHFNSVFISLEADNLIIYKLKQ